MGILKCTWFKGLFNFGLERVTSYRARSERRSAAMPNQVLPAPAFFVLEDEMKRIAIVTLPANGGRIFTATFKTTRQLRRPRLQRKQDRNARWLRSKDERRKAKVNEKPQA